MYVLLFLSTCRQWMKFLAGLCNAAASHNEGAETPAQVAQRWWMPYPYKHSRSGSTGLWATWSGWRCPGSLKGGWTIRPLKDTSNPNQTIPWFRVQAAPRKESWLCRVLQGQAVGGVRGKGWRMLSAGLQHVYFLYPIYTNCVKNRIKSSCIKAL